MLKPEKVLIIKENEIKAKYKCSITIDLNEYDNVNFIETSDHYFVPGSFLIWVPEFKDSTQLVLPYNVKLFKTENMTEEKSLRTVYFKKGDNLIKQDSVDTTMDMGFVKKLLDGNIKYIKEPEVLVTFIAKSFQDIDLVHIELIVSNMFREQKDDQKLCRWTGNYKNALILGQNQQPLIDSWTRAMSFQHIDKAFIRGLTIGRSTPDNAYDRLINNDFS